MRSLPCSILTALVVYVASGESAAQRENAVRRPMEPAEVWPSLNRSPVQIEIIHPISTLDLARIGAFLRLSEEQATYVTSVYQHEYRPAIVRIEAEYSPQLREGAARFQTPLVDTPAFVEFFEDFRAAEERLCSAVTAADQAFLVQIELSLSPVQQPFFNRVRLYRQRHQCLPYSRFKIQRATIDLSEMVHRLDLETPILGDLEPLLVEYESRVTPALVQADRLYRDGRAVFTRGQFEMSHDENGARRNPASPAAVAVQEAITARHRETRTAMVTAQLKVAEINDAFIVRIVSALPRNAGTLLREEYLSRAFPRVYPDPLDVIHVYEALIADARLIGERRALIDAHWERHQSDYRQLCAELEVMSKWWQQNVGLTNSTDGWTQHESNLNVLLDRRSRLNERFFTLIESIIRPTSMLSTFEPVFTNWRSTFERVMGRPVGRTFNSR